MRLAGIVPPLLAIACVAGIVHLVSVLILPLVAPNDAFARVSHLGTLGKLVVVPRDAPELGPFRDPALAQAVCFFDLRRAPLRLRTNVDGDRVVTLSFHARHGAVFYAMTDKAALRGRIDVLVLTAKEQAAFEAEEGDEPSQDLHLVSPTEAGFVLVSTLVDRPDERDAAVARLAAVSCGEEAPPPGSGADD